MSAAAPVTTHPPATPEAEFAALVETLACDPGRQAELVDLLREDHSYYDQRGSAAVVRMRGWVLLALGRSGLRDEALLFVLEELDAGLDAYLVAAAARALRSYDKRAREFAPFVLRGLTNMGRRDEPVCFDEYGAYPVDSTSTTAVRELLRTLAWLGPAASNILPQLEALWFEAGALPKKMLPEVDRTIVAIKSGTLEVVAEKLQEPPCCALPGNLLRVLPWKGSGNPGIGETVFEDTNGQRLSFDGMFRGHPSIVVFFYTRCDNPLKCSLTITKLGRVQKLLEEHELADRIHTAAITYDPEFDLPDRIRGYGERRGVQLSAAHRMLRATDGIGALREHFKLGVNFIESLVNRHRIEAYVLDCEGRVAYSFERLQWNEAAVVDRAAELLNSMGQVFLPAAGFPAGAGDLWSVGDAGRKPGGRQECLPHKALLLGPIASITLALLPKCPVCWAAYLSFFGIAGLAPYSPWLQPLLVLALFVNLMSVWVRALSTGRMTGAYLATAGALTIAASRIGWTSAAPWGVALTFAGSLLSALKTGKLNLPFTRMRSMMALYNPVRNGSQES